MKRRAASALLSFAVCLLVARAAIAQNAAAEAAFEQGRALMAEGKYAEACTAFGKSHKIDPQLGTLYNLGQCFEKAGRTASAWAAFREVAQRDGNASRKAKAAERAAALEPKLTKLLINVAGKTPGLVVKSNDADVTDTLGIAIPVDPGSYRVEASASGYRSWHADVAANGAGLTVTVAIPTLEVDLVSQPAVAPVPERPIIPEPAPPPRAPGRFTTLRLVGVGVAIVGVGALGGGVVFGLKAKDQRAQADAICPSSACGEPRALTLNDDARSSALKANVLFVGGGAALAGAVALWLLGGPSRPAEVVAQPIAAPSSVGIAVSGRF